MCVHCVWTDKMVIIILLYVCLFLFSIFRIAESVKWLATVRTNGVRFTVGVGLFDTKFILSLGNRQTFIRRLLSGIQWRSVKLVRIQLYLSSPHTPSRWDGWLSTGKSLDFISIHILVIVCLSKMFTFPAPLIYLFLFIVSLAVIYNFYLLFARHVSSTVVLI